MDKYEITQREYEQVMGENPSFFKSCDNCPVEGVTWYKADEYCRKVEKRLPTEWELEKAAKSGTTTKYYWGESENMADSYAWYYKKSGKQTHPVGQKIYAFYSITVGRVEKYDILAVTLIGKTIKMKFMEKGMQTFIDLNILTNLISRYDVCISPVSVLRH